MYIPCSSSSKIGVKRKIGTSLGVLLCCHQHLVFLQEAKSPTQNFFWMGLGFFKVVFVPYIPDCPSRHYPPFQLHQRQLFHQHLKRKKFPQLSVHFWSPPLQSAHMFLARAHSHNRWPIDSGC